MQHKLLSNDVWEHICQFFKCKELYQVAQTNHSMYATCQNNYIWKMLVQNELRLPVMELQQLPSDTNWKMYYKNNLYCFKHHGMHIELESPTRAQITSNGLWETAQVNRLLTRGHTYQIAFALTKYITTSNSYEVAVGLAEKNFDFLQPSEMHTVMGHYVSPNGISLAVQDNSILNEQYRDCQVYYAAPNGIDPVQGDVFGVVLKHGATCSKVRFYKNGTLLYKLKGILPDDLYFGVSLYWNKTVSIVPFKV